MAFRKLTNLFPVRKSAVLFGLIGNVGANSLYYRLGWHFKVLQIRAITRKFRSKFPHNAGTAADLSSKGHAQLAAKSTRASTLRNKLIIRFKLNPDSAALTRQSFRNALSELHPRSGLGMLTRQSFRNALSNCTRAAGWGCFQGDSFCTWFPGLKAWAIFCSPFGRLEHALENVQSPGPGFSLVKCFRQLTLKGFEKRRIGIFKASAVRTPFYR